MRPRPKTPISLLFLATIPLLAQTQQQPPGFTEKVEVNVRTVLAVVTDAKGKPIERPLSVEDVEVLEDGIPAKVLITYGAARGGPFSATTLAPR